ncbi:VOC family protein [Streptomyces calidiresistens]|uniref:Glyoxalase n=1 Tax=Streptomyces calidiresistens TaxID=1485586 RepID=A0A7W3T842_9ACTN|nr:VOC family protein [Streptomyces calidiresistens]MBB0232712.1 glyoxalase [Streptomyces calidiresistens]
MRMIFVNLPVKDLSRSREFFTALGFSFNEDFSDDHAAYVVVEENIGVMLLTEERFKDFVNGPLADPDAGTGVLVALSAESRREVDDLLARALAAGAEPWKPVMDEGPMYGASFRDPDGHVWEVMHMDMEAVAGAMASGGGSGGA